MSEDAVSMRMSHSSSPVKFFLLFFVLSVPFWLIGSTIRLPFFPFLPLSSLMAFCPLIAALILVYLEHKTTGVIELLKRTFDFVRIRAKVWYVPIILLVPAIVAVSYLFTRVPLPTPQFTILAALAMLLAFFIGALGEELGWSGYAIGPLQARFGALQASVLLGVLWALWHVILYLQEGRSLEWIGWYSLFTIATRVVMVWIFNNTGKSVFGVAVFHAMLNFTFFLLPNSDEYFDPQVIGLIMSFVAVAVTLLWGSQALSHFSFVTRKLAEKIVIASILGIGVLGVTFSLLLLIVLPVFHFPKPTGPYAIGTVTYRWIDTSRTELFTGDSSDHRELMVQIWYPSMQDLSLAHAPYMQDADAVIAALAHLHNLPDFVLSQLKYVTTNAFESPPVANNSPKYPVVIFLEGLTGYRQMNTFQVEELVSHGYVVVGIDQPGVAATVLFPDGRYAAGLSKKEMDPLTQESIRPNVEAPLFNGTSTQNRGIPYFAQDVSFVLDQLTSIHESDTQEILTGKLDLQRIGLFGVSFGAIVGAEGCMIDKRLKACLFEDAAMPAIVVKQGLRVPSMWITRDAETMRLERQKSGGWTEEDIEQTLTTQQEVFASLEGDGYYILVPGMFHIDLTDLNLLSPLLSTVGLSGPIDAERAHAIINAYSTAFFDKVLLNKTTDLLDVPLAQFPEVIFKSNTLEVHKIQSTAPSS